MPQILPILPTPTASLMHQTQLNSTKDLSVLPRIGLLLRGRNGVEWANAGGAEVDTLDVGEDLVLIRNVGRAGNEATLVLEDGVVLALLRLDGPTAGDAAVCVARVGDGVLHGTGVAVNVDLLTTWNHCAHEEAAVSAGEVGVLAWWACTGGQVRWTIGSSLLSDPQVLSVGSDASEMDRGGGVDGDEREVLGSRDGRGKACNGGKNGGGLHCWMFDVGS